MVQQVGVLICVLNWGFRFPPAPDFIGVQRACIGKLQTELKIREDSDLKNKKGIGIIILTNLLTP